MTQTQAVLMFHGIGTPTHTLPADEVPYWITEAFFSDVVNLVNRRASSPEVVFTFDDGNKSDLAAARVLASAGIRGKFYVLAGRLGKSGYLSNQDLLELDTLGMEVGLHGTDHIDWRYAPDEQLEDEIVTSRNKISDIVCKPVNSVAIPFGAYNRRVIRKLQQSSFDRIYTSDTGLTTPSSNFHRRNPVLAHHAIQDIENIIIDAVSITKKIRRTIMPWIKRNLR
jgi:peptidoglycan/xylan/chitin deacetylase (PgdA/CDA1 family)